MNRVKVVKRRKYLKTLAQQAEDALFCQRKVGGQSGECRFEQAEYKFLQDFHLIMLQRPLEKQGWNLGGWPSESTPIPTNFL